jgi:hypothetical protein
MRDRRRRAGAAGAGGGDGGAKLAGGGLGGGTATSRSSGATTCLSATDRGAWLATVAVSGCGSVNASLAACASSGGDTRTSSGEVWAGASELFANVSTCIFIRGRVYHACLPWRCARRRR